jgi:hypothetical protein
LVGRLGPGQALRYVVRQIFDLMVCIVIFGGILLHTERLPRWEYFGGGVPVLFFCLYEPSIMLVLSSVGLFEVRLLRKSEAPAGLSISLDCVYVCCRQG